MLCSSAIERLQADSSTSPKQALIYHFFTVTDHQSRTSDALIRNLVYQLASHDDETRASTIAAFREGSQGNQPANYDQLLSILGNLLTIPSATSVIIDALDESVDQTETCAFLKDLCDCRPTQTRVLVSSNTTQSLQSESTLKILNTHMAWVSSMFINKDIEAHIRKLELSQWNDDQRDKIVSNITKRSDGSFRWAIGQMADIEQCNTEEDLDEALSSLPENLTETYERTLSTIQRPADIKNLRTLLCWLLHARRPLGIEELREAVGINVTEEPHFDPKKRLNQRPKIFDQCTFLIVADRDSDMEDMFAVDMDSVQSSAGPAWQDTSILRLAHSSVVQYLDQTETLSNHSRQFAVTKSEGHILIARSCLTYILYVDSSDVGSNCPLFDYAISHWYYHVQQCGIPDEKIARLVEGVLQTRWDIYRLVTYPNISTRYNPWLGAHVRTSEIGIEVEQDVSLCPVCRELSYQELQKQRGMRHRTYVSLVTSAHECRLCKMIHCALLQFGIARYCQMSSEMTLSLQASEEIAKRLDAEMNRTVSNSVITLRMETQDPFLLISCYCYFGRLHLYTNPGSPMASSIFGRPVRSNSQSLLPECQEWLQECRQNHSRCHKYASPRCLPSRLIEVEEERIRLIDNTEGTTGRFATLTCCWGAPLTHKLCRYNYSEMKHGMRSDHLPRLLQDVIRVAQGLGLRYLWIDSLCIIQESWEDWQYEAGKIPEYFTNAEINIVAGAEHCDTKILCRRLSPRFQPIRFNGTDDVFIGWLGTDAYIDPRGLRVSQYPDAWKYKSPVHQRRWRLQEMELARRNLILQCDEESTLGPGAKCTTPTSQLYMQCQEEIRWENGRRRRKTVERSANWYDLVEEYSGRSVTILGDRLAALWPVAHRYSRASQHRCGVFLAGLWSNDLLRGLLWRAEGERTYKPADRECLAPSWSWAALPGRVKHVWPSDATPLALIKGFTVDPMTSRVEGSARAIGGYIRVRSLLVGISPVRRAWSTWNGDIEVDVRDGNDHRETLMIRYTLDNFDPETTRHALLYGIRITRRIGLLLGDSGQGNGNMKRVGLFIVAKPDTLRWMAIIGERDVKII